MPYSVESYITNEKFSHDCDGESEFIFTAFMDVFIDEADTPQTLLKLKNPLDYLQLISERPCASLM